MQEPYINYTVFMALRMQSLLSLRDVYCYPCSQSSHLLGELTLNLFFILSSAQCRTNEAHDSHRKTVYLKSDLIILFSTEDFSDIELNGNVAMTRDSFRRSNKSLRGSKRSATGLHIGFRDGEDAENKENGDEVRLTIICDLKFSNRRFMES